MTDFSLTDLETLIRSRLTGEGAKSYTKSLLDKGVPKCAQKLGEEAVETVIAALGGRKSEIVAESADLLYHLLVVWAATGVRLDDVLAELARRTGQSGHDEKAARPAG